MAVAMVQVGDVRVGMLEGGVSVGMGMRLRPLIAPVLVLMVLVVDVPVVVLQKLMNVSVGVLDPDQEPRAGDHQQRARSRPHARDLAQEHPGQNDGECGGGREEGRRPRRAEMTERGHLWDCECDCGRLRIVLATDLRTGRVKRCEYCSSRIRPAA